MVELLSNLWQARLTELLASSSTSLILTCPFIKHSAAEWLLMGLKDGGPYRTTIITDFSASSVLGGSLDLSALALLVDQLRRPTVVDVRRLHAKVYVADEKMAIITSGNLTFSAFERNYEYGVMIREPDLVQQVVKDLSIFVQSGRPVTRNEITSLEQASAGLRAAYQRQSGRVEADARRALVREWDSIASRMGMPRGVYEAGSARFKDPVVSSLARHGSLTTPQLCAVIQGAWPYLCDDNMFRVAKDGSRKRQWRHDVHTAQETLRRQGIIERDKRGRWSLRRRNRDELHHRNSLPRLF